jgi:hypothetical protein
MVSTLVARNRETPSAAKHTWGGDSGLDRRLPGDASPTLTDRQIDRLRSFGALQAPRDWQ